MKKKFSFVLAIIMIVCSLSVALVACAPKDPDAFAVVDKGETLGNLWDSWAKENMNITGNKLGIDATLNLKDSKNNLTIKVQGGISQDDAEENAIRFAIEDNNKTDEQKSIVDFIINSEAMYVYVVGISNKPMKSAEIKLPDIGTMIPMQLGQVAGLLKPIVVNLVADSVEDDVIVDPIKNGKTYDANYKFTIKADVFAGTIISLLESFIAPEDIEMVESISQMLQGIEITISADTTGNVREKDENAMKGEPKYKYYGGKLTSLNFSANNNGNEMTVSVGGTGIKLQNTIPTIAVPTDTIDLNDFLVSSIFKSSVEGNISLKDANGISQGDYKYTLNLDFEPIQLITSIQECVKQKSANPLIKQMMIDQKGKFYFNIDHTCGSSCKTNHFGGKKMDGSVATIAFSPEDFGNNRIYVSFDLQTLVNDTLLVDVFGQTVGAILKPIIPNYYTQFSFDLLGYTQLTEVTSKPNSQQTLKVATEDATMSSFVTGIVSDDNPFSIGKIFASVADSTGENKELQISIDTIRAGLEKIRPLLKNDDPNETTYNTILKAINSTFKNVDKIAINSTYTKEVGFEQNVYDLFIKKNETENKDFGGNDIANGNVIKGQVTEYVKDSSNNIMLYYSTDKKIEPLPYDAMYDSNGGYLPISYDEIMALVDKNGMGTAGKVKYTYTDLFGNNITTFSNIVDIVGLDKTKIGEPQEVKLVLFNGAGSYENQELGITASGVGSNLNNILKNKLLINVFPALKTLTIPELVVKTTITLSEVESVNWTQEGIADKIDMENIYNSGDVINTAFNLSIKYKNVDSAKVVESINAINATEYVNSETNQIEATSNFTLNYDYCGYEHNVDVKVGG